MTLFRVFHLFVLVFSVAVAFKSGFYIEDENLGQTINLNFERGNLERARRSMEMRMLDLIGLEKPPNGFIPQAFSHRANPQAGTNYLQLLYKRLVHDRNLHISDISGFPNLISNHTDALMSLDNEVAPVRSHRGRLLSFPLTHVSGHVQGVTLRLYRPHSRDHSRVTLKILLAGNRTYEPITSKLSHNDVGWVSMDLTHFFRAWKSSGASQGKLRLRLYDENGFELHSLPMAGFISPRGPSHLQPFLLLFLSPSPDVTVRRTRRALRREQMNAQSRAESPPSYQQTIVNSGTKRSRPCSRRSLYVNFADLGWGDWIINPDAFSMDYCAGACDFPLSANMNATNHAIVQTLIHLLEPLAFPKACCVPTSFSSLLILYLDSRHATVIKTYENMKVVHCGCH